MKVHFITFGCKVNMYETENIKQAFSAAGHEVSAEYSGCDAYVVNSCTVTETGDRKIKKAVRRIRRENPSAVIALTGCFPQVYADEAGATEADIITGTKNRAALPGLVEKSLTERRRITLVERLSGDEPFEEVKIFSDKTRAFLKIQDGCQMNCSYCIIPKARGAFRSKPLDDIAAEAKALAANGHKEIAITGINLSFYGAGLGLSLADAVEAVCGAEGIERVRLSSIEPERFGAGDIERLSKLDKLCPHFHLSLQSGSDRILKAMNRRYDTERYYDTVCRLRESFSDCSITTDVIAGFPGETEEDFLSTLSFIEKAGFSRLHAFPFSARKGTAAEKMEGQIPLGVRRVRARELIKLSDKLYERFAAERIGRVYPVLFEEKKEDGVLTGYTPNYMAIKIFTKKDLSNNIFYVKIKEYEKDFCPAELV